MAVSIQELIEQKEKIQAAKKQQYDLETSIGTVTIKVPTRSFVAEASKLEDGGESDKYLLLNTIVSPNLKDTNLQQAYGCAEPTDIVDALFEPGEIAAISRKVMKCAGYGKEIKAEIHEEAKN